LDADREFGLSGVSVTGDNLGDSRVNIAGPHVGDSGVNIAGPHVGDSSVNIAGPHVGDSGVNITGPHVGDGGVNIVGPRVGDSGANITRPFVGDSEVNVPVSRSRGDGRTGLVRNATQNQFSQDNMLQFSGRIASYPTMQEVGVVDVELRGSGVQGKLSFLLVNGLLHLPTVRRAFQLPSSAILTLDIGKKQVCVMEDSNGYLPVNLSDHLDPLSFQKLRIRPLSIQTL
jgi:hypothetical protein